MSVSDTLVAIEKMSAVCNDALILRGIDCKDKLDRMECEVESAGEYRRCLSENLLVAGGVKTSGDGCATVDNSSIAPMVGGGVETSGVRMYPLSIACFSKTSSPTLFMLSALLLVNFLK